MTETTLAPARPEHLVERAARWLAWLGGAILAALSVMTVVSIVGRSLDGVGLGAVRGDYEMVANGCALAVFYFLPWCQLRRGHVTVDILTNTFPARIQAIFGLIGDLLITIASAVILRQLWFGFGEKFPYGSDAFRDAFGMSYKPFFPETTYELQVPVWILYAAALLGAAMMVIVGLYTVRRSWGWVRDGREGAL
ncbi:TRAP transporter small permease [Tropicimonas sediminicola]|uniref:TRAP transporter small permease protein n=1 Tax=Tropicimonas sediminicola TaxID=1031541 RepID=A0A239M771_9RHOB|nr:TRAP transporter small permease [Tropicimonas sediminicola]SNT37973.1 TRAP-type C4-dicarboxylate transport system, small permease component [Tropicimonas sediminicola]